MRVSADPIVINGSHGEGGSALLRTALAVSVLTQQPVRLHSIRGATRKPGITSEDLTFIRGLGIVCGAETVGDELDSEEMTFSPRRRPVALVHQRLDVSAFEKGSVPGNALVVLESLLPVLARTGSYSLVTAAGETYNANALSFDYFENVTLAVHRKQGLYAYAQQLMAGFGYAGMGEVSLEVEPSGPNAVQWEDRGKLVECRALVTTSELPDHVGMRGTEHVERLAKHSGIAIDTQSIQVRARGPGAFVTIWAEFERGCGGATAMGQKGVRMEAIAQAAYAEFMKWYESRATVDRYVADQMLLPAALADGESVYSTPMVTRRLTTVARVIKQFLPIHITILGREGEPGTVTISR